MTDGLAILAFTAVSVGFFHTLFGPDHYVPFVVLAKTGRWSVMKISWITVLCGLGHILSSVGIGLAGVVLGIPIAKIESLQSHRGDIAAWALIAFGLVYLVWGIRKVIKVKVSDMPVGSEKMTPWILFLIFIFGPCELLIPLVMYPAAKSSVVGVALVAGVFGLATILTMLTIVLLLYFGINLLPLEKLDRYSTALAGAAISLCGILIHFFGL